jgi:tRNA G46 methylase TrmB
VFRDDVTETFFRLLKPGGEVHLRTDVPDYFDVMEGLFEADRRFCRVSSPHALLSCKTGFECRFIAKGKLIFHASFRVVTDSSA